MSADAKDAVTLAAWVVLAGSLATVTLCCSCSRKPDGPGQGQSGGSGPVPVLVAEALAQDVPMEIGAIGTVQAYSTVAVRPQITGKIVAVHFQEGQDVRVGDRLFTLDSRPWEAALNQAQANLKRDEAQLLSTRLEFERTKRLFESKIASQQDYDSAEAAYRALEATLLADQAAISNAQVNLSYTEIRSPIEGRTGSLTVKAGNVVKAPDDILLTITQVHPIYVAFAVTEQHLPAIRRETRSATLPVQAVVPGETNHPAHGELTFINNTVDVETGTILLKATFANADNMLWPGQFVQVSMTLRKLLQATLVPSQAVQNGQEGEFVYVVQPDETVAARPVVTSLIYHGFTVIDAGLNPGETVVTDGQLRLVPGARVSVKTLPTQPPSTTSAASPGHS